MKVMGVAYRWGWVAFGGRGLQAVGVTGGWWVWLAGSGRDWGRWVWLTGSGRGLQAVGVAYRWGGLPLAGVACRQWAWLAGGGRGLQTVGVAYRRWA